MEPEALQRLLAQAAEQGARQALAAVGLTDAEAGRDIGELRSLLTGWRDARRTALQSVVRWATALALSSLAVWSGNLWRERGP